MSTPTSTFTSPWRSIADTTASTKHALRLAKRWSELDTEIDGHDQLLDVLTANASPTPRHG